MLRRLASYRRPQLIGRGLIWGCFRNPKTRFAGGLFDPNFDLYSDRSGYSRKYQSWWCHLVFLRCLGSVKYVRSAFLTHGFLKATGVPLQCPSCSAIAFLMGELEIGKDVVWEVILRLG